MSKVDELKKKFTDFLEDLKKKLPTKGSKGADDDTFEDEDGEEYEEGEDIDEEVDLDDVFDEATSKVNIDPQKLAKDAQADDLVEEDSDGEEDGEDNEEDEDEDEDEKKKKQKQMLIRGLLGLVVLYLVYDTLMPSDDDTAVNEAQVQQMVKKRPRRARKNRGKKKVAQPADNVKATAPQPKKEETKPIDQATTKKVVAKPVATPVPPPEATPEPTATPEVRPEPTATPEVTPEPTATPEATPEPTATPVATAIDEKKKDQMTINVDDGGNKLGENAGQKAEEGVESVTDAIMKDLKNKQKQKEEAVKNAETNEESSEKTNPDMAYVAPPNYRRVGRGLVYNCTDRHWACVDKFAYFQCRENYKYNKVQKKKFECVVRNVYASNEDCSVIQTYYINMGEATDFCNRSNDSESKPAKTTIELNGN